MQVHVYSTRLYDRQALERSPGFAAHHFTFLEARLDASDADHEGLVVGFDHALA